MELMDRITGKKLEAKVDEYSKVYGEVLMGIHRDVESQNRRIHDYSNTMQALLERALAVEANVKLLIAQKDLKSFLVKQERQKTAHERFLWLSIGAWMAVFMIVMFEWMRR